MIDYDYVLSRFKDYLKNFDCREPHIALKVSHSYHVADLASKLAKRLELDEEKIILAKTIGLLHDIGRFTQYQKVKKYSDEATNTDHALMGLNYLFQDMHIKDFNIPEKYYDIIRCAIENHNKYKIDDNLSEEELLFAKIIRDVDKIDIFRASATAECISIIYDGEVTNEIKEEFNNHQLVDRKKTKTNSDIFLAELAFIYDINFQESYELLMDSDNLELFMSMVDVTKESYEEFLNIKKDLIKYINKQIEGGLNG